MDIAVIIMGVIAVAAGIVGFVMEHRSDSDESDTENK